MLKIQIDKNKNGTVSYSFSKDNYNAGLCGLGHTLSVDKRDIPQGNSTYDAARANIGSPWMMFTKDQGKELIDNTTSEWTGRGRKFISKTNTSKYIFLPAGGYWDGTTHKNEYEDQSSFNQTYGWYSSPSIWTPDSLQSLLINKTSAGFSGGYLKRYGMSIRAVCLKQW